MIQNSSLNAHILQRKPVKKETQAGTEPNPSFHTISVSLPVQQEHNSLNIYRCILLCAVFPNWMGRKDLTFLWQRCKCGCCSGNHKTTFSQDGCWEITWNHLVFCPIKPAGHSEFRQSHNVQYLKNGQIMQKWYTELITVQGIRQNGALEGNHRVSLHQSDEQWCLFIYLFRHLGYVIEFLMFAYLPLLVKYISYTLFNF